MLLTKGQTGFIAMLLLIALGLVSLEVQAPVTPLPATAPESAFSAERAMAHLRSIAAQPHSGGTIAHQEVRNYLLSNLKDLGLNAEIQTTTGHTTFPGTVIAGRVQNIIARLPGLTKGPAVLLMAHYDSQPHTPGAGDDGSGVAALLETARALVRGPSLTNEVIFLFTDLEEAGLLGARAFVDQHPLLDSLAVVLNFEARGNRGAPLAFEWNPENGWIVRAFAEAAPYPVANAISYEIYRRMPNDTDFTPFRERRLTGLNSAFMDGFVHYHSMTDRPERLDQRSLQQQGANMLALARHFGRADLSQTKAPDIIFFNPIGSWLLYYPAHWNLPGVGLLAGLFLLLVILGHRNRRLSAGGILAGAAALLLTAASAAGLAWLLSQGVQFFYPHYQQFYNSNFYNSRLYLFAFLGLGLLSYFALYRLFLRRWRAFNLSASAILVHLLLLTAIFLTIPTGTYLIAYPLLAYLAAQFYVMGRRQYADSHPIRFAWPQLLGVLPAVFLWVPMIDQLFVVFSLSRPMGPVVIFILLLSLATPLLDMAMAFNRRLLPGLALVILFGSLIAGHLSSFPTPARPLQTNLWYAIDADIDTAIWASTHPRTDSWNRHYLRNEVSGPVAMLYPDRPNWEFLQSPATAMDIQPPVVSVLGDTIFGSPARRVLELQIRSLRSATSINCRLMPDGGAIHELYVDGQMINMRSGRSPALELSYYAPEGEGFHLKLVLDGNAPLRVDAVDRSLGLPEALLTTPLPRQIIPGPGYLSHVTLVRKSYSF